MADHARPPSIRPPLPWRDLDLHLLEERKARFGPWWTREHDAAYAARSKSERKQKYLAQAYGVDASAKISSWAIHRDTSPDTCFDMGQSLTTEHAGQQIY